MALVAPLCLLLYLGLWSEPNSFLAPHIREVGFYNWRALLTFHAYKLHMKKEERRKKEREGREGGRKEGRKERRKERKMENNNARTV
jgi:hypothetical protein